MLTVDVARGKEDNYKEKWGSAKFPWSLQFHSIQLEEQFMLESAHSNKKPGFALGLVLVIVASVHSLLFWRSYDTSVAPRMQVFVSEMLIIALGVLLMMFSPMLHRLNSMRAARISEVILIVVFLMLIALTVTTEMYRAALLWGMDPHEAWPKKMMFADTDFVLILDSLVTASIFFRINSAGSNIVPITAVLAYILSSFLIGTPIKSELTPSSFVLTGLCILASVGRRCREKEMRAAFAERQRLFWEKSNSDQKAKDELILRFAAEHELDRNRQEGGESEVGALESVFSEIVKPGSTSTVFNQSSSSGQAASSGQMSQRTLTSAKASSLSYTHSDAISESTAKSTAKRDPKPIVAVIGTQTYIPEFEDKETSPLIVWTEYGFECQRCAKPPIPPSRSPDRKGTRSSNSSKQSYTSSLSEQSSPRSAGSRRQMSAAADFMPHDKLRPSTDKLWRLSRNLMVDMCKHWNFEQSSGSIGSCCRKHAAMQQLQIMVADIIQTEPADCSQGITLFNDWQCIRCSAINDDKEEFCGICGESISDVTVLSRLQMKSDIPSATTLGRSAQSHASVMSL